MRRVKRQRSAPKRRAVIRNRRGESTRAAILSAAHRLLKEQGFAALSVDRVARAAGVTRSSIYHQFHSRDAFLLHLIADSLRRLQREGCRSGRDSSATERRLDEAEAGFRGDPNLFRMFYQLVFNDEWNAAEPKALLREAYRFRTQRVASALEQDGVENAETAETLAVIVVAALDGLYARRIVDLGPAGLRRAFRALSSLVRTQLPARRDAAK